MPFKALPEVKPQLVERDAERVAIHGGPSATTRKLNMPYSRGNNVTVRLADC
jgi:hypothetical protein